MHPALQQRKSHTLTPTLETKEKELARSRARTLLCSDAGAAAAPTMLGGAGGATAALAAASSSDATARAKGALLARRAARGVSNWAHCHRIASLSAYFDTERRKWEWEESTMPKY